MNAEIEQNRSTDMDPCLRRNDIKKLCRYESGEGIIDFSLRHYSEKKDSHFFSNTVYVEN